MSAIDKYLDALGTGELDDGVDREAQCCRGGDLVNDQEAGMRCEGFGNGLSDLVGALNRERDLRLHQRCAAGFDLSPQSVRHRIVAMGGRQDLLSGLQVE
jgi:hypothetical protein